jgi:monoterpene epsilon-lactone hydrolase
LNRFARLAIKGLVERKGLSIKAARAVVRLLDLVTIGSGHSTTVRRRIIAGVPCDVISPRRPPPVRRVVLYLHGGGFCVHFPRSYRQFARRLVEASGATVYVPAYRLAPEHRHPAATDDCLAAYRTLLDEGCDPRRLSLIGDSAGGNLALVTLLRARDEGVPLPACAVLMSPGADLSFSSASYRRNVKADPFVVVSALHQLARQYVDADQLKNPYVSPARGDFAGLPPFKFLVGSTEVLIDDSLHVAESCRAAGVEVSVQVWHQMPHVFPLYRFLPEAQLALRDIADFVGTHTADAA